MTTTLAPNRSVAQRRAALEVANARRYARAELKRRVRIDPTFELMLAVVTDPRAAAAEHLPAYPEDVLETMAVRDLIEAGYRVGPMIARKLLARAWGLPLPESTKRLGALTTRRHLALIGVLEDFARERAANRHASPTTTAEEAVAA